MIYRISSAPNLTDFSPRKQTLDPQKNTTVQHKPDLSGIVQCRFSLINTNFLVVLKLKTVPMSLDQLKAFLVKMQNDEGLKQTVLAASTADDVARIALELGFEFSGDELLRFSGKTVGRVTVSKQDHPGEYH